MAKKLKIILLIAIMLGGIGAFGQEKMPNESVPVAHGSGKGEGATLAEAWKKAYTSALQNLYEYYYNVNHIDILMDNNKGRSYWNLPPITIYAFMIQKNEAEVHLRASISQKEWMELRMTLDTIINNIK